MTAARRLELLGLLTEHLSEGGRENGLSGESTIEELAESIADWLPIDANGGPTEDAMGKLMAACGLETA